MNNLLSAALSEHSPGVAETCRFERLTRGNFADLVNPIPHFYPIIDLLTDTVLGYEVLSRGHYP